MNNGIDIKKNEAIIERTTILLNEKHIKENEIWGHPNGRILKIAKTVLYIAFIYSFFISVCYFLGIVFTLSDTTNSAYIQSEQWLNLISLIVTTIAFIFAFILIKKSKYKLGSIIGLVSGIIQYYILFKQSINSQNPLTRGNFTLENSDALAFAFILLALFLVVATFLQYKKPLHFAFSLISGVLIAVFFIWQIASPLEYFGGGFSGFDEALIFILIALLILEGILGFMKSHIPYQLLYFVPILFLVILCWYPFYSDIVLMGNGFNNFYLRDGFMLLLIILASSLIFIINLLEKRRVQAEIDVLAAKVYATAPKDSLLTAEQWDELLIEYFKNEQTKV